MSDAPESSWRELIEKHHTSLAAEISVRLDAQLQRAVSHAVESERASATQAVERTRSEATRTISEHLNQAIRIMRQAASRDEVLRLLAEISSSWSEQALVLSIEKSEGRVASARGLSSSRLTADHIANLDNSPALSLVLESKDPVITVPSESEIPHALAAAFGGADGQKLYLFPTVERHNATAVLFAFGRVAAAPLELLCEAAGMRLDVLASEALVPLTPLPNPALVQVEGAAAAGSAGASRGWNDLSPEDQLLHLKAQRAARVGVAEIRLYQGDALRGGLAAGDIYGALTSEIDRARAEFLQTFLSKSPTMVDYLHLEILRSLAHDDDRLLGEKYPGPMV